MEGGLDHTVGRGTKNITLTVHTTSMFLDIEYLVMVLLCMEAESSDGVVADERLWRKWTSAVVKPGWLTTGSTTWTYSSCHGFLWLFSTGWHGTFQHWLIWNFFNTGWHDSCSTVWYYTSSALVDMSLLQQWLIWLLQHWFIWLLRHWLIWHFFSVEAGWHDPSLVLGRIDMTLP